MKRREFFAVAALAPLLRHASLRTDPMVDWIHYCLDVAVKMPHMFCRSDVADKWFVPSPKEAI